MINILTQNQYIIDNYMYYIWLGIFLIAILIEVFTNELVSVWFAGGSFIAFILSVIPGVDFWIEILVFVISSGILLLICRPFLKKSLFRKETKSNVEEMIGKTAKVIKQITPLERGEIKLYGVVWTAENSNENEIIEINDLVTIEAIQGNKVIVKKVSNKEEK